MPKPKLMKVTPEQFARAITYFESHGWDRWGVVMLKGEHEVSITFDMAISLDGDPATAPPELMRFAAGKGNA